MRESMISVLKLDVDPQVSVGYAETFRSDEPYRLLEVDEALLQELLHSGLTIKGGREDEAVLCTSKATFAMKFVSTSNTVLLVPPSPRGSDGCDAEVDEDLPRAEVGIVATASGHIELVETAPRLENLQALVSRRPFKDDENLGEEEAEDGELYTWDELSARTQASDHQLRDALRKLEAAEIGRFWRVVDPDYMHNLLGILLSAAVQNDWSLKALQGSEVIRSLEAHFPAPVVITCLDKFGVRAGPSPKNPVQGQESCGSGAADLWALDDEKICIHYAKLLLRDKTKWKLEDFLEEWAMITPSWMSVDLNMLRGEALVEKVGLESWLHQFSCSLLPCRPDARFTALFSRRSKWEWEDLEPYLKDLRVPGQSVEAMLLKYTRKSQPTPTSTPVYTAR
ncbi:sister chromatid cohesion protein DCC1 [Marchantia polymorpha subsp. ruderalis]|uniref:Sister chromatid cohesion protein DCC1 n=2 Tax=Marchantia polymorpha TaxID=3197 RepID=A0AAF6ASK1_MARPO|nr:hypothetical protein MARPO_0001s0452 [Marchantia polymorpha]BBM99421.1 hypothetical protein Mp_1g21180 [Marchantia polymorpha subsp. ruderalis]|eukprot:PTQ50502.1 hypothetical protein MARPO_0001s0452 [Marchantia polymorpha]